MTSEIPTLVTERLTLRAPVEADFAAFAPMMASPRSAYMGGPYDQSRAWGVFCHDVACWHLFGHGALMIDLAATGECIGQVGINHGPLFPEKELGWWLYEKHEGNGYATEAALALRTWAFDELRVATLVSYIDPKNALSVGVALRLGGFADEAAPRQDADDLVYRYVRRAT